MSNLKSFYVFDLSQNNFRCIVYDPTQEINIIWLETTQSRQNSGPLMKA